MLITMVIRCVGQTEDVNYTLYHTVVIFVFVPYADSEDHLLSVDVESAFQWCLAF